MFVGISAHFFILVTYLQCFKKFAECWDVLTASKLVLSLFTALVVGVFEFF